MSGTKRRYEQVQPQLQRDIVADYQCGVRGHGLKAIAKAHQVPRTTIRHVLARAEGKGGDPITPRGHKRRKLDGDDEAKLCRELDRNPFATNRELAAAVGNKISERRVSDYLARAKPRFTAKVVQDQEPEELTKEWKTEVKQWLEQVKRIPLDKRIYEDETPIYANEAPTKGRSQRANPYFERGRGMQKSTHCTCTQKGVV
jgi:transposase